MAELEGKIVIVTGASGALGAAVVEELSAHGARAIGIGVRHHGDAERGIASVIAEHGRIDALVNTAGGFAMGEPVASLTDETWRAMMDANLDLAFRVTRAALGEMVAREAGSVVHVGSRAALEPMARAAAYAVSKAALVALVRNAADEVRQQGVRVNCVLPSVIDTPKNRADMPAADHSRWVKPVDIARVIRFLVSDDSAIVSGAAIPVYGRA